MSCAIFASAVPLSRSAFGAKSGAERTTKRDPRPSAGNTPPISTDGRRTPWSFAKIGHGIVSFAVRFPVLVLGPGEKSAVKQTFEVEEALRQCRSASVLGRKLEEDTMVKLLLTAVIFSAPLAAVAANGQSDGGYVAPELSKPTPGQLLDEDYLTSTGETVARPGVPQSSGETPFDRSIRQQNDRIDNSICKGC
jgi:hypothetical protein